MVRVGHLESDMKLIAKSLMAAGLAMSMAGVSVAEDLDPTGLWVAEENSDYQITRCGDDNSQLCVKLAALRGKMRKERNLPYLDKIILQGAKPNGANRWKGKMTLFGHTGEATLVMTGADTLNVKMCAYVVVCDEFLLERIQ